MTLNKILLLNRKTLSLGKIWLFQSNEKIKKRANGRANWTHTKIPKLKTRSIIAFRIARVYNNEELSFLQNSINDKLSLHPFLTVWFDKSYINETPEREINDEINQEREKLLAKPKPNRQELDHFEFDTVYPQSSNKLQPKLSRTGSFDQDLKKFAILNSRKRTCYDRNLKPTNESDWKRPNIIHNEIHQNIQLVKDQNHSDSSKWY